MNGKISVIVPVYRVKRYLSKCIESVLLQDYGNWELLLVNDGSPDSSVKICNKYAGRDCRIQVINKENGGVSSARNMGLDTARGDYIFFLDADDFLPCGALSELVRIMEGEGADLAVGAMLRMHFDRQTVMATEQGTISVDGSDALAEYVFRKENPLGYIASKLFKTSIIKENGIKFNTDMRVFEDAVFTYEYLKHCDKISRTPRVVYCYNQILANTATNKYYDDWGSWAIQRYNLIRELIGEPTEAKVALAVSDMSRLISEVAKYYYMRCPDGDACRRRLEAFLPEARGCLNERELILLAEENPTVATFDSETVYQWVSGVATRPSPSRMARIKRGTRRLLSRMKEFFVFTLRPRERFAKKNYKRG